MKEKKGTNKFHDVMQFVLKQYPAYLWSKPSIWRLLLFPFLFIYSIFGKKKDK